MALVKHHRLPGSGCTVSAQTELATQCKPPQAPARPPCPISFPRCLSQSGSRFTQTVGSARLFAESIRSASLSIPFNHPLSRNRPLRKQTNSTGNLSSNVCNSSSAVRSNRYVRGDSGEEPLKGTRVAASGARNASPAARGEGYAPRSKWEEGPLLESELASDSFALSETPYKYSTDSAQLEAVQNGSGAQGRFASERVTGSQKWVGESHRINRPQESGERTAFSLRGVANGRETNTPESVSVGAGVRSQEGKGAAVNTVANDGVSLPKPQGSDAKSPGWDTKSLSKPSPVKQTLRQPAVASPPRRKWEEIVPEEPNPVKETQKVITGITEALVSAGKRDERREKRRKWEERKSPSSPPPVLPPPPPPPIERTRLSDIITRESRVAELAEECQVSFQGDETDWGGRGGLRFFREPMDLPEVDPVSREQHIAQWLSENGLANRKKEEDWFSEVGEADALGGVDQVGLGVPVRTETGSRRGVLTQEPVSDAVPERGLATGLKIRLSSAEQRADQEVVWQTGFKPGFDRTVRSGRYAGERVSGSGRGTDRWRGTAAGEDRQNDSWRDGQGTDERRSDSWRGRSGGDSWEDDSRQTGRGSRQQRGNSWRDRRSSNERESDSWQNGRGNGPLRSDSWRSRSRAGERESDSWQTAPGSGQQRGDNWRGRSSDRKRVSDNWQGEQGNNQWQGDSWQAREGNGNRESGTWRNGRGRNQWEVDSWRGLADEVDENAGSTGRSAGSSDADMNGRQRSRGGAYSVRVGAHSHRVSTVEVDRDSWLLGGPTPKSSSREDDLAGYTVTGASSHRKNPEKEQPEEGVVEGASDLLGGREFVRVRLPKWNDNPVDAADLHQSIMQRDFSRLWWLVEQRGVDVNQLDDRVLGFYTTALHIACEIGDAIMVKRLVSNGARANVPDEFGRFPMVSALIGKEGYLTKMEVIEVLLETGVGLEQRNPLNGKYPMHYAVVGPNDVLVYLKDKGASLDVKDLEGRTPLHDSLDIRDPNDPAWRNMDYLLGMGAKSNAVDKKGRTALHIAAERHEYVRCKELLRWKANVNARDKSGRTPMRYVRPQPYGEDSIISLFQRFHGHL